MKLYAIDFKFSEKRIENKISIDDSWKINHEKPVSIENEKAYCKQGKTYRLGYYDYIYLAFYNLNNKLIVTIVF